MIGCFHDQYEEHTDPGDTCPLWVLLILTTPRRLNITIFNPQEPLGATSPGGLRQWWGEAKGEQLCLPHIFASATAIAIPLINHINKIHLDFFFLFA